MKAKQIVKPKKIVIKPVSSDPIKQACGVLSFWKKSATQIMKETREEEEKIEKNKLNCYWRP